MRLSALVLILALAACGPHPLAEPQPTAEALGREVLTALARRDTDRLRALAISESEFEHRVWPALPASRPERNMPWSYVWMDLRQKSDATLQRTLKAHGGRRYELEAVKFDGDTTAYGSYSVARDARLIVRDSSGVRHELQVLGSMISGAEGWKVFSYLTDE